MAFQSPAEDYIDVKLDLTGYLAPNPLATYYIKVKGNGSQMERIYNDSLLIVDRSLNIKRSSSLCLCVINNDFKIMRLSYRNGKYYVLSGLTKYEKEIEVTPEMNLDVWGIITRIINEPS